MRSLFRRRPSAAMVVASAALLVALGGTSIAAVSVVLPRNSVGTRQLQDSSVTAVKIAAGAVRSRQVLDGSLRAVDFAVGQLPRGRQGLQGPPGPAGASGAAGPAGPQGAAGVIGAVTDRTGSVSVTDTTKQDAKFATGDVSVSCHSDEKAIAAGTSWSDNNSGLSLVTDWMTPTLNSSGQVTGFSARGGNDTGQKSTFTLHVLCYKG